MTTEHGNLGVSNDHSMFMSLSSLDDSMLKEQSMNSDPKQADIIEKLRALQVVEEMIKNQEHLLSQHSEIPKNKNTNDTVSKGGLTIMRPAIDPNPSVSSGEKTMTKRTNSKRSAVGEGNAKQLKLLNAKIAQRRSKVDVPGEHETVTAAAMIKQSTEHLVSERNDVNTPNQRAMKSTKPFIEDTVHLESSASGTKAKPLMKVESNPERPPITTYHMQGVPVYPSENVKLTLAESSPVSQTPEILQHLQPSSRYEASLDKTFPGFNSLGVSTTLADTDPDLLSSTSYYVLASECVIDKNTLDNQFEAALRQEPQGFSGSLASSLTHAYGLVDLLETSEILSTLQNPKSCEADSDIKENNQKKDKSERSILTDDQRLHSCEPVNLSQSNDLFEQVDEEVEKKRCFNDENRSAIVIQSAWKRYMTRKHDPEVIEQKSTLNNRLETLVLQSANLLEGCRQELAHQSHVIQLQEETLNTLLVEVDGLRSWKKKMETKNNHKAAITIQKYWKGYMARKCFPCSRKTLSKTDVLWNLCVSLKAQVQEMMSNFDALTVNDGTGKRVTFENDNISTSPGDLPPPTDLKMSHFSLSCILLTWAPANVPSFPDVTTLKCYRIYVNGEIEGMVGSEKLKAYIEGLDSHINYRITVRAVYNTGESLDSNPVVASLNPGKLPLIKPHSPNKLNSDHSSDEDGGHSRKNPSISPGETSHSPRQPLGQLGNSVNNGQQPKEQTGLSTLERKPCLVEHQEATIDPLLTQSKEEISIIPVQTESAHIQNDQYPSNTVAHTSPSLKDYPNLEIESFDFQKARHITIDTVSVLSGCTIEYSQPVPQASNSADTLIGESSFECDDDNHTSSENRKNKEIHGEEQDKKLNTHDLTLVSLIDSDKGHGRDVEQGKTFSQETSVANEISHSPTTNLTLASTQQRNASSNVTAVRTDYSMAKPLKTSIHEMHTPHSEQLSHMSAPVLYAVDEQLLSLASTLSPETNSMEDTIFNSLPELNHRNICKPLATNLEIYPQQSKIADCLLSKGNTLFDEQGEHVSRMASSYEAFPRTAITLEIKNNVPPVVTHETTSLLPLHTSHTVYKQQVASQVPPETSPNDTTLEREHQNKELGSCVEKPSCADHEYDLQEPGLPINEVQEAWQPDLTCDVVETNKQHVVPLSLGELPRADQSISKET